MKNEEFYLDNYPRWTYYDPSTRTKFKLQFMDGETIELFQKSETDDRFRYVVCFDFEGLMGLAEMLSGAARQLEKRRAAPEEPNQ